MKVLFLISHPAHFWMYRYSMANIESHGGEVIAVIRPKDILTKLCDDAGLKYYCLKERPKKWGLLGLAFAVIEKSWSVFKIAKINKPDVMIASDGVISWVGKLLGIPSFENSEDDEYIIKTYAKIYYPFYTNVLSPTSCSAGKWENKCIHYPGFQKLCYMHPHYFQPNIAIKDKYIHNEANYFLIRLSGLNAYHDGGVAGINTEIAQKLIDMLLPYGRVYITSERPLEPQFEQYRLAINPLDIHHVMAFATLYIGDSQSMAVEAAMLGTPSLRFNDFVGAKKIGVMEELEHTYGLTYGISSKEPNKLYAKVEELLAMDDQLKPEFQKRRQKMLADKIDVTAFLTWFIENFPQSAQDAKRPDFNWSQFR